MEVVRTLTADRGDAGARLDVMLCRRLHDVARASRARVQAWIARGRVSVNGRTARRAAVRLSVGDTVSVVMTGDLTRRRVEPEDLPVDVLFEDEHLIALNKPAGIIVHPTYKHPCGTLLNALLWRCDNGSAGERPAFVGRLDRLTSGVVVAAKSAGVYPAVQRALAAGEKTYLAVVYGRTNAARGVIDLSLGRDPSDKRRVIAVDTGGAPSITRFERLARANAGGVALALLRCRLVTGRTHQIRVHLSTRGWPIVGDPVYGEPRWSAVADPACRDALRGFPRQALHSSSVRFDHPITGERVHIAAPLPDDIVGLCRIVGLPLPDGNGAPAPAPAG